MHQVAGILICTNENVLLSKALRQHDSIPVDARLCTRPLEVFWRHICRRTMHYSIYSYARGHGLVDEASFFSYSGM